jgi:transcriptional regulator with XRE-family HTH domain
MSDLTERKYNLSPSEKFRDFPTTAGQPYSYREMPAFRLGRNVRENIKALRAAMGSATRELSRADLAKLITDELPTRPVSDSTIRWWERGKGQPEYHVAAVMARFAGVSFEQFCLGTGESEADEAPNPALDRGLTDEEALKALERSERDTRERAARETAAANRKGRRRRL